jgi:soluble lytic murein transglycosylase-like protein
MAPQRLAFGVLVVAGIAGFMRGPPARDDVTVCAELERKLAAAEGELALAQIQLQRAGAINDLAIRYRITPDVAAAIYDIALSEGIDPPLAFRLVSVESQFNPRATSRSGAIGYTQTLLSTARLYEERYETNGDAGLGLALLAYNRGPARLQELLDTGRDPHNGYATAVMTGYRP